MYIENKCSLCVRTICCTYVTQKIAMPRTKADFEHLLWQVSHEGIEVYKDEDGWYLLIQSRCSHILANGQCAIYETRPPICRNYDNDFCEFDEPAEKHFERHFKTYEQLLAYCKRRFRGWR